MQPNAREKKCIDCSILIRRIAAQREFTEWKEVNMPFFLLPRQFAQKVLNEDFNDFRDLNLFKKAFLGLAFVIIYLLGSLGFLLYRVFHEIARLKLNNVRKVITAKYSTDYRVSGNKSIVQLWSDKGLKNIGSLFYGNATSYSMEEQILCANKWIALLYELDEEAISEVKEGALKNIARKRHDRAKSRQDLATKGISHISYSPFNEAEELIAEVQSLYGNYL